MSTRIFGVVSGCSFPTPGCSALLGSVGARFAAAGVGENGDDRGLPSRDSVPPWPSNADWASGGIAQSCAWLAAQGRPTIRRVIRPADGFIAHEIAPPTGMADGAAKMMLASPCVLDAKSPRRVVPARAYRARGRAGRSRRPRLRFGPPQLRYRKRGREPDGPRHVDVPDRAGLRRGKYPYSSGQSARPDCGARDHVDVSGQAAR